MDDRFPVPRGVDINTPSSARIYDYALGGKNNYPVDRAVAEKVFAQAPEMKSMARQNRGFLRRAVRFLVEEAGVRQFLDLGSGLPTGDNVHEVAQEYAPDTRVVYVDRDPLAVTHGQALLATNRNVAFIQQDLRNPETILGHPEVRSLIDFDRPFAVLLVAVLHFVPDEDEPLKAVTAYRAAIPSGGYLAVSHVTSDTRERSTAELIETTARAGAPWVARSRTEITRFFEGFDLVEPGLVTAPEWRHHIPREVDQDTMWVLAGVGRKP